MLVVELEADGQDQERQQQQQQGQCRCKYIFVLGLKPHRASSAPSRSPGVMRQSESAIAARIKREASWSCAEANSYRARAVPRQAQAACFRRQAAICVSFLIRVSRSRVSSHKIHGPCELFELLLSSSDTRLDHSWTLMTAARVERGHGEGGARGAGATRRGRTCPPADRPRSRLVYRSFPVFDLNERECAEEPQTVRIV